MLRFVDPDPDIGGITVGIEALGPIIWDTVPIGFFSADSEVPYPTERGLGLHLAA